MYHLVSLDANLNPRFFITRFLLGLKDELRMGVRLQQPTSITSATVFARIQEEQLAYSRLHRLRLAPMGRPPSLAVLLPALAATGVPRMAGADDFGRERQLREFRRDNGPCFRCGDKYTRELQCG